MTTAHRITTATAVILSLAAAGVPTAIGRAVGADTATAAKQVAATVYSRAEKSLIPVPTPERGRVAGASAQQAVVRIQMPQSGFDWGDAGIGAAGGVALAMLSFGGALVITHRPRRARDTSALPS